LKSKEEGRRARRRLKVLNDILGRGNFLFEETFFTHFFCFYHEGNDFDDEYR